MSRARTSRTSRNKGVMSRMYGSAADVDPEGPIKEAIEKYETFSKKEPRGIVMLRGLPDEFEEIGKGISVMYETDKWKEDGQDERYKHVHGNGVRVFEPVGSSAGGKPLPVTPPTPEEGFARLGRCLGYFVQVGETEREYNPPGTDLFTSPTGNLLGVYCPSRGWVAFMTGGRLRVEAAGIDG